MIFIIGLLVGMTVGALITYIVCKDGEKYGKIDRE